MPIKVYVSSNQTANFQCTNCGKSIHRDVSKFIAHETQIKLKYTCKCGHSFSITLERRRSIRKEVTFKGSITTKLKKYPVTIENISKEGLKIKMLDKVPFGIEEIINVEFTLDDVNRSKISVEVRIKNILSQKNMGCEFTSSTHWGNLGKYFLFNY